MRRTSAGHRRLVGEVEAVQRLVEDEQLRAAHERGGDEQPLLLAARELADGAVRVGGGADQRDHLVDPPALLAPPRPGGGE